MFWTLSTVVARRVAYRENNKKKTHPSTHALTHLKCTPRNKHDKNILTIHCLVSQPKSRRHAFPFFFVQLLHGALVRLHVVKSARPEMG